MLSARRLGAIAAAAVLTSAAFTAAVLIGTPGPAPAPPALQPAAAVGPAVVPAPVPQVSCADRIAGTLAPAEIAGQLLVVAVPLTGPQAAALSTVSATGPGGVMLAGRGHNGTAPVTQLVRTVQEDARKRSGIGALVTVDQEGGLVQSLSGPGIATIPAATTQSTWTAAKLHDSAKTWGAQLAGAGVNLDLAPVADVLDHGLGAANLSVGVNRRTYGTTPDAVTPDVLAFSAGMHDAGVAVTFKHFPGLGAVGPNTDTSANVHDTVTDASSPVLDVYRAAVQAGVPVVMVSSAIYDKLDPASPAAFSAKVIGGLLRDSVGFHGVVISDDLGNAAAVAKVAPGDRAVRFVDAGGDLVLSVDPATARPMLDALTQRIGADPAFAAKAGDAVRRVLALKETLGLLSC